MTQPSRSEHDDQLIKDIERLRRDMATADLALARLRRRLILEEAGPDRRVAAAGRLLATARRLGEFAQQLVITPPRQGGA